MYTSTAGVFGDRWAHRTQPTPLAAEVLVDADADAAGATAVTSATRPATSAVAADNLNARNKDLTGLTSHFQIIFRKCPPGGSKGMSGGLGPTRRRKPGNSEL